MKHVHKVGRSTLVYYDTKEEIGGHPGQSVQVPKGYEPMSGNYMVISPFRANPWVVAGQQDSFSHPGDAWLYIYASGGYGGKEIYSSQEPGFRESANPSSSSRLANQELNRESDRHIGDLDTLEVSDMIESDSTKIRFNVSVDAFTDVGYRLRFYEHKLNRPSEEDNNPVEICFGVSQLSARDRNSSVSERNSIQRWEDFENFLDSPLLVMSQMERGSVLDGFCLPQLHGFGHSADTKNRNDKNCSS